MANEQSCACAASHTGPCAPSLAGSFPQASLSPSDAALRDQLALQLLLRGHPSGDVYPQADEMMHQRAGGDRRIAELEAELKQLRERTDGRDTAVFVRCPGGCGRQHVALLTAEDAKHHLRPCNERPLVDPDSLGRLSAELFHVRRELDDLKASARAAMSERPDAELDQAARQLRLQVLDGARKMGWRPPGPLDNIPMKEVCGSPGPGGMCALPSGHAQEVCEPARFAPKISLPDLQREHRPSLRRVAEGQFVARCACDWSSGPGAQHEVLADLRAHAPGVPVATDEAQSSTGGYLSIPFDPALGRSEFVFPHAEVIRELAGGDLKIEVWARTVPGTVAPTPPPFDHLNPNIPAACRGCGRLLLLRDLMVCDGCPCNSKNGVNFDPWPCDAYHIDHCTRPGHRLHALGLAGSTSAPDAARPPAASAPAPQIQADPTMPPGEARLVSGDQEVRFVNLGEQLVDMGDGKGPTQAFVHIALGTDGKQEVRFSGGRIKLDEDCEAAAREGRECRNHPTVCHNYERFKVRAPKPESGS